MSPALADGFFTTSATREAHSDVYMSTIVTNFKNTVQAANSQTAMSMPFWVPDILCQHLEVVL